MSLPPCGLYRTTSALGPVEAGTLVSFHNHGDPGPGIYVPEAWVNNRATFRQRGFTLEDAERDAQTLTPLVPEGLYRVTRPFVCCEKQCRSFAEESLVQVGYNRHGKAILFLPNATESGVEFPERGTLIDDDRLSALQKLVVPGEAQAVRGGMH